ncbi:multidrug ABC transporter ATP-binding protein [Anopheles sinensis]|uniref:Multidrug ABC transporter ATP-binding protein n=1 Tax=Anopheles sinensis TaxID=74873 RepID=A0A084WRF7_ANOSI|nr:multidrug ABC transporter ATP-binding protein [Anopheles sinensis]
MGAEPMNFLSAARDESERTVIITYEGNREALSDDPISQHAAGHTFITPVKHAHFDLANFGPRR